MNLLIYVNSPTPRLTYITNFLFQELLGLRVQLTNDRVQFQKSTAAKIDYSKEKIDEKAIQIVPHGLLKEKSIHPQNIDLQFYNSLPYFFKTSQSSDFQYDILAASFYLISRYEEYLPFEADKHGRFPASESLAYKAGFLELPVVNLWVLEFKKVLKQRFPQLKFKLPTYRFQPTLDIDMAWSYRFKGWKRTLGGTWNNLKSGAIKELVERPLVLARLKKDPYHVFVHLNELHRKYGINPIYFFLVGTYGEYDKNIAPEVPAMRQLIKENNNQSAIGVHPSYCSNEDLWILRKEVKTLSEITLQPITKSRQHYLKICLPDTYQNLIKAGIQEDYSMGFADEVGFRASVAHSFPWYDLKNEETTSLRIHPFQLMDVTLKEYLNLSPQQAEAKIAQLLETTKQVGGNFQFIWHNSSFSSIGGWEKWKYLYEWVLKRK
ncbi:MAG: polysaccharide deacetylase family protein [Bacteroidota bacterium]